MDNTLDEHMNVRVFKDTRKKIDGHLAAYPDRWDNESHFVRAAIENFCRQLAMEEYK